MRIRIVAVGRLKSGPEQDLFSFYRERFERTGRPIGFDGMDLLEIDERKGHNKASSEVFYRNAIQGPFWAMDERGKTHNSRQFADIIADFRDQGRGSLDILIGGADGLSSGLVKDAERKISFGPMVWPHMLARVMLAEQLYRAMSILSGQPYHRD